MHQRVLHNRDINHILLFFVFTSGRRRGRSPEWTWLHARLSETPLSTEEERSGSREVAERRRVPQASHSENSGLHKTRNCLKIDCLNLLRNAASARGAGRSVTVDTRHRKRSAAGAGPHRRSVDWSHQDRHPTCTLEHATTADSPEGVVMNSPPYSLPAAVRSSCLLRKHCKRTISAATGLHQPSFSRAADSTKAIRWSFETSRLHCESETRVAESVLRN